MTEDTGSEGINSFPVHRCLLERRKSTISRDNIIKTSIVDRRKKIS